MSESSQVNSARASTAISADWWAVLAALAAALLVKLGLVHNVPW